MSNLDNIVKTALGNIATKDRQNHESVESEIKKHGTYWAASEILRLRKVLAAATKK
jgi:hypothetical protein